MGTIVALGIALGAGALMAIQGTFNSSLGKVIGFLESIFIVQLTGFALVSILLYLLQLGDGDLGKAGEAPWYLFLGGVIGVVIVYGVVVAIDKVGVTAATTAIIVGQVSTAAIVDHWGLFGLEQVPFTWLKFLGFILLVIGGRLLLS
ncbi:MAG: DMT family transporter [Limnochordia bacterium]